MNNLSLGQGWPPEGMTALFPLASQLPRLSGVQKRAPRSVSPQPGFKGSSDRTVATGRRAGAPRRHHTHHQGALPTTTPPLGPGSALRMGSVGPSQFTTFSPSRRKDRIIQIPPRARAPSPTTPGRWRLCAPVSPRPVARAPVA